MAVAAVAYAALMMWLFRSNIVNLIADAIAEGIRRSKAGDQ